MTALAAAWRTAVPEAPLARVSTALSVARLTLAPATCGRAEIALSTRRTQEAQVIPSISSSIWAEAGVGARRAAVTPPLYHYGAWVFCAKHVITLARDLHPLES